MVLFKYLQRKHLEGFLSKGSIRIGTLYDYRRIERYGSVIGDDYEGLYETELSIPGGGVVDMATNSYDAEAFRKYFLHNRPDLHDRKVKLVFQPKTKLITRSTSQNLYIYCMSSEYNEHVMKEFKCDSCLEIINPEYFFAAISKRIRHKASFDGYVEVSYLNKRAHYTKPHSLHPAIMKDPKYEYQKEWRAIWSPIKTAREPLLIDVPKAIKYSREHRL